MWYQSRKSSDCGGAIVESVWERSRQECLQSMQALVQALRAAIRDWRLENEAMYKEFRLDLLVMKEEAKFVDERSDLVHSQVLEKDDLVPSYVEEKDVDAKADCVSCYVDAKVDLEPFHVEDKNDLAKDGQLQELHPEDVKLALKLQPVMAAVKAQIIGGRRYMTNTINKFCFIRLLPSIHTLRGSILCSVSSIYVCLCWNAFFYVGKAMQWVCLNSWGLCDLNNNAVLAYYNWDPRGNFFFAWSSGEREYFYIAEVLPVLSKGFCVKLVEDDDGMSIVHEREDTLAINYAATVDLYHLQTVSYSNDMIKLHGKVLELGKTYFNIGEVKKLDTDFSKTCLYSNCWTTISEMVSTGPSTDSFVEDGYFGAHELGVCSDLFRNALHLIASYVTYVKYVVNSGIGNCSDLQSFILDDDHFIGKLLDALFSISPLEPLSLQENMFVGTLSNRLCNLSKLCVVDVSFNVIVGALLDIFERLRLEQFSATSNSLDGKMFEEFIAQMCRCTGCSNVDDDNDLEVEVSAPLTHNLRCPMKQCMKQIKHESTSYASISSTLTWKRNQDELCVFNKSDSLSTIHSNENGNKVYKPKRWKKAWTGWGTSLMVQFTIVQLRIWQLQLLGLFMRNCFGGVL